MTASIPPRHLREAVNGCAGRSLGLTAAGLGTQPHDFVRKQRTSLVTRT